MPSVVFDGGLSGAMAIVSGNPWSGQLGPIGGIQLLADRNNSGNLYIGLSGGMSFKSGGYPLSGGGIADGMQLGPGGAYFVPKSALRITQSGAGVSGSAASGLASMYSGNPFNIFCLGDAALSGQGRIFYEAF